jgi:hypothetical protein
MMIMAPQPKKKKTDYCFICGILGRFEIFYKVVSWHLKHVNK